MRKLIIGVILIMFSTAVKAQSLNEKFVCHVKDIPFSDFCKIIFKQTSVKIYYQENWVSNLKVTLNTEGINPLEAVEQALNGTKLQVSVWNNALLLLPDEKLILSLPKYNFNGRKDNISDSRGNALTESEQRYLTGRKTDKIQVLQIGNKSSAISGSKAKILGRILDEETGEPLFCATIYITETKSGAVSDINGFITLALAPGSYNALFEYLGYEKKRLQIDVLSDGNFSLSIKKAIIQIKELTVFGDRQMNIRSKDPGLDKISVKAIRELPMMMGERDILKISVTLPGIVSIGEGSTGLNVRGGGADQNAFYINKVPIYNTSHLFGFFPAFNADIIKDFSIYKGHIPAQYGGHLSSVFNIITRQGNRKNFTVRGGISPITGNLVVEGPLKKDTSSFILSARSSYSDWILKRIKDIDLRQSNAGFNDFSAGLNYDIQKTQISLFAYHSFDRFKLAELNSYEYTNNGTSASFSRNFTNSLRGEVSLIGSQYTFSTIDKQEVSKAYEHTYKMEHFEVRVDFKQMINDKNTLEYGFGSILYKLNRGNVQPYGELSYHKKNDLGKEQGVESSVYITEVCDVFPWLNVTSGIRYSIFNPIGAKDVYRYDPNQQMDIRNITDTLSFARNQVIKWYHEPDLRIALNFKTDSDGSIKLAFNRMHQNLFMLNTTAAIAPNTQWKLADYHLLPSKSYQVSAGIFRSFTENGLEASAEMYFKQTENYPEFRDGADFLNNPNVETAVLQGRQNAWGVEFFLKRSLRKAEGWVSYTYSHSNIKIDDPKEWLKINNGESYPANFDIPHSLNLVLNYHISRRITIAAIIAYQTGKPVTYPVSVYFINELPILDYSKRNAYRIPDYFRTDFSFAVEGNLRKKKLVHSSFIFSLYNATGRDNPYSVYFKTENGLIRGYKYSVVAVPVFTATWLFKLGNYASE